MSDERFQTLRLLEALLFASAEPLRIKDLEKLLPEGCDIPALLEELAGLYANRGVTLVRLGERWAFRTAPDLAPMMTLEKEVRRRLSRAAIETLAIIAYHQPVTRAEVEEIRGVGLSRGTLDTLLEAGWIRPRGRRKTPGRPVTWGTSDTFLDHFGLETLEALPGQEELRAAGLLDSGPALAAAARMPQDANGEAKEDDDESDEEETGETDAELLAADFGEDLVPDIASDDAVSDEAETAADESTAGAKNGA